MKRRRFSLSNMIWLLAIGYLAFYIPYSGLVKSLSNFTAGDAAWI